MPQPDYTPSKIRRRTCGSFSRLGSAVQIGDVYLEPNVAAAAGLISVAVLALFVMVTVFGDSK